MFGLRLVQLAASVQADRPSSKPLHFPQAPLQGQGGEWPTALESGQTAFPGSGCCETSRPGRRSLHAHRHSTARRAPAALGCCTAVGYLVSWHGYGGCRPALPSETASASPPAGGPPTRPRHEGQHEPCRTPTCARSWSRSSKPTRSCRPRWAIRPSSPTRKNTTAWPRSTPTRGRLPRGPASTCRRPTTWPRPRRCSTIPI